MSDDGSVDLKGCECHFFWNHIPVQNYWNFPTVPEVDGSEAFEDLLPNIADERWVVLVWRNRCVSIEMGIFCLMVISVLIVNCHILLQVQFFNIPKRIFCYFDDRYGFFLLEPSGLEISFHNHQIWCRNRLMTWLMSHLIKDK